MAIATGDVIHRLSGGSGNSSAAASLGGAKSSTAVPGGSIFDDVDSGEATAGDTEYRCFYVHNNHGSLSLQNAVAWISANTTGNRISIGVGTAAINGTEQSIANESTAPSGVTFSQPSSKGAGLALGTIPAGQHKAVWVRRVIPAAAAGANDTYTIRAEGDTAP